MNRIPPMPIPPPAVDPRVDGVIPEAAEQPGRSGFWSTPFAQNLLPFLSSLTVHAVVIVLGVATAKVIISHVSEPQTKEQVQPAISEFRNDTELEIPNFNGPKNELLGQMFQDINPDVKDVGFATQKSLSLKLSTDGAAGGGDAPSPVITIGLGDFGRGTKTGPGRGDGTHGDGESGHQRLFGVPNHKVGGNGMFKDPVIRSGNAPRRIVYVCDASGSMINRMATLRHELGRAVDALRPIQSFGMIFFQDHKFAAIDEQALLPAKPENKARAHAFLGDVTTSGTTDPIPGLELAFRQKPQLVYLLTDGDFPDNDAVLRKIKDLNRDGAVKINTIAFVDSADDSREGKFVEVLQSIARDNGGSFRLVLESDLQQ